MIWNCSNRLIIVSHLMELSDQNSSFYTVFYLLDVLLHLLALLSALYFLYLIYRIRVWHLNMNIIVSAFCLSVISSDIGNLLITFDSWRTEGVVTCTWKIETGSFLLVFYCVFVAHLPICILIERCFALLLVTDYESKTRIFIPVSVLSITSIGSFLVAEWIRSDQFFFRNLMLYDVIIVTVPIPFWVMLERANLAKLNYITTIRKIGEYTLSIRLQLKENLRVFKLARNVLLTCISIGALLCLYIFVTYESYEAAEKHLATCLSFGQIMSFLVCIGSCQQWRWFTRRRIWKENEVNPERKESNRDDGALYFSDLERCWNN